MKPSITGRTNCKILEFLMCVMCRFKRLFTHIETSVYPCDRVYDEHPRKEE